MIPNMWNPQAHIPPAVPDDLLQENLEEHPNDIVPNGPRHDAHVDLDRQGSTMKPKWWEKLIGNVRDDELLEGQSSRGKSIHNTVIFSLMANIQGVYN